MSCWTISLWRGRNWYVERTGTKRWLSLLDRTFWEKRGSYRCLLVFQATYEKGVCCVCHTRRLFDSFFVMSPLMEGCNGCVTHWMMVVELYWRPQMIKDIRNIFHSLCVICPRLRTYVLTHLRISRLIVAQYCEKGAILGSETANELSCSISVKKNISCLIL